MEIIYNYIGKEHHTTYEIYVSKDLIKSITYTKPFYTYGSNIEI